jgi:hypothetical protein
MPTKHEVIALNKAHPDWTQAQIAEELGCMREYVSATFRRNGLSAPVSTGRSHEEIRDEERERCIAVIESILPSDRNKSGKWLVDGIRALARNPAKAAKS